MFTAEQIKAAHGKVKSGADFPAYIQEIKALGVLQYETYVSDGHIDYHGDDSHTATTPAKYALLAVAPQPDSGQFQSGLTAHQQGKTDFLTFIKMCATHGIKKWVVNMNSMTCIYYDSSGNVVLSENIPQ